MLSVTLLAAMAGQALGEPFLRYPDVHGSRVVFTSEGDLWLGDLKTGLAHRLTSDAGIERNACFSPDGSQIAFEGEYDGQRQAYVMPTDGGPPRKLTSVEGFRAVTGWTPDGKRVVIRTLGVPTAYTYSTVSREGGVPTKLPLEFASHVWYGPTPDRYTFTRFNRWSHAWFRYVGGMQNQIWIHEPTRPGGKPFRQITNLEGTNEFPTWCGDRIYFANENKGRFALMSVPASGGKPVSHLTSDVEIRELSTDGRSVVYERGQGAELFDVATGKVSPIKMKLDGDLIHTRPNYVSAESFVQSAAITPTGKRLLVEARGQILSVPLGEGEARVWKATPGVRYRHPSMSVDAKKVAFVADTTGEQQVYVANADGTGETQLTTDTGRQLWGTRFSPDGKWVAFTDSKMTLRLVHVETKEEKRVAHIPFTWFSAPFDFSPDSKWVAYTQVIPGTLIGAIELYEIATGKVHRVSDGRSADTLPAFSSDGRFLVFTSTRHISTSSDPVLNQMNAGPMGLVCIAPLKADDEDPLAPKDPEENAPKAAEKKAEFRVDLEGLFERRIELPTPPANVTKVAMVGNRVIYAADGAIKFYDIATKASGDVASAPGFTLSGDNQTLLLAGNPLAAVSITGENRRTATFGGLRLYVSPVEEWKQIFWDAWRHLRDYFYVPNMHGLDWQAIGSKYARHLPSVRSRDELDELIRWMQAEIGSSHQYLSPGDTQDIKTRLPGAYLGVDLAEDPSGFFKIAKIFKGDGFRTGERSPLLGPGRDIREGMFLVAIGGEPIKVGSDPYAKLAGRAGRTVSVTVNVKPGLEGAKTYLVRPVASEQRMRYLSWVEANRQYVLKASDGRLGYLHLAAMSVGDMNDFIRQYFYQRDKEGLVIDTRFNNGGFVQDYINRILASRITGFFNMRDSELSWTRQQDFFSGPMVCLTNEFAISCGEEFPHRFKDLKLGPLIGRRTMGGEVGSDPGWPLVDGGRVSVPNYGMWTPDGKWAIEGAGVSPDIDVPSDPNAFVEGRDPQIDKGVEYLLAELKRRPNVRPVQPKTRDRVGGG